MPKAYITHKKFTDSSKNGWWIWIHNEFDMVGNPVSGPYLDKAEAMRYYRQLPDSMKDERIITENYLK